VPQRPSFDIFFDGRLSIKDDRPEQPYEINDRLFDNRWRVVQVVPAPNPPPEFEVYAVRCGFSYVLRHARTDEAFGNCLSDKRAFIGDVITFGVDRWRVVAMRDLHSDLFDGTLIVERVSAPPA
jgi:hypothetical protein